MDIRHAVDEATAHGQHSASVHDRAQSLTASYLAGATFQQAATKHGLSGERARQLILQYDPAASEHRRLIRTTQQRQAFTHLIARAEQALSAHPGLSVRELESLLGQRLTAEHRKVLAVPRRTVDARDRPPGKTEAQVFDDLRWAAQHAGEAPLTGLRYDELRQAHRERGMLTRVRIWQLFGSWSETCSRAGINARPPVPRARRHQWTRDQTFSWVTRFLAESSGNGSFTAYARWAASHNPRGPGASTVRCNLDGARWADIKRQALILLNVATTPDSAVAPNQHRRRP